MNRRPSRLARRWTILLAGLMTMATGGAWAASGDRLWSELPPGAPAARVTLPDFAELAERLSPAVVNISVEQERSAAPAAGGEDVPLNQFAPPEELRPHGVGSGFIINRMGYILTNDHVVSDARMSNGTTGDGQRYTATLVGRDPKTDIALVKIAPRHPLPFAPLGDSRS